MRFKLYTTKNVKQCTTAINDRLKQAEQKARDSLHGYTDKGGTFTLAQSSKVAKFYTRTTRLNGKIEREGSVTVISGTVSEGVPPGRARLVMGALALAGFVIMLNGQAMLGILAIILGLAMYIPLVGDHDNSAGLLKEVKRTLEAKDRPPA